VEQRWRASLLPSPAFCATAPLAPPPIGGAGGGGANGPHPIDGSLWCLTPATSAARHSAPPVDALEASARCPTAWPWPIRPTVSLMHCWHADRYRCHCVVIPRGWPISARLGTSWEECGKPSMRRAGRYYTRSSLFLSRAGRLGSEGGVGQFSKRVCGGPGGKMCDRETALQRLARIISADIGEVK
jgi:hypothetical protein